MVRPFLVQTSLVVAEENPLPADLIHESPDLSVLELDDLLLLSVDPTRENQEEELPRAKDEFHGDSDTEDWIDHRGESRQLERGTGVGELG